MSYRLALRPKYAPDEETWEEGLSRGIGGAIEMYERQREEGRAWENEVIMAGGEVTKPPTVGDRWRNRPRILGGAGGTAPPRVDTPGIERGVISAMEPYRAPVVPLGGHRPSLQPTPGYNPHAPIVQGEGRQGTAGWNERPSPRVDPRGAPQTAGIRDPDPMIEQGRSPYAISTQRTGTSYGDEVPADYATLRGPGGRTARIDRNRGTRQEVMKGGIARRIAEGEEENDIRQQVDALVRAGWNPEEAEARVRSNTVAFGRWKGEQRPPTGLTFEQRVQLQNMSSTDRMKLEEYRQRMANARASMARATAAQNREAYERARIELAAIAAEAANDRIDLALADDLSPAEPFDRRMMGRTPEGVESIARGDEIRAGVQQRTEERRGRTRTIAGQPDPSLVEQVRQLSADFRRSHPNASEEDIKRWVKRRIDRQRATAPK